MFLPDRVIFEKEALDYALGKAIYDRFVKKETVEMIMARSNRVGTLIPDGAPYEKYRAGKKTLVVGVKKSMKFQSCKPSAHYQLPLVSGCMGQCEYCYLNTQLGDKPYVRVFVNQQEILKKADDYIAERNPEVTIFEGAATSDPVPVEPYTHALERTIVHFGEKEQARFRFVTKYNDIDGLIGLPHGGHTTIRVSINTEKVIKQYEHFTAAAPLRITAAAKLAENGYPIGFIIAPVILSEGWKEDYLELLKGIKSVFPRILSVPLTFEVITHRFTTKAKNTIQKIFPETTVPMDEALRQYKYGQFGYGKYVYPKETLNEVKAFFEREIQQLFEYALIQYII